MQIEGVYYAPGASRSWQVSVDLGPGGQIRITGAPAETCYRLRDTEVSQRVGDLVRTFAFNDGALCEVRDNDAVDRYLAQAGRGRAAARLHWVEQRWTLVLAGIAALAVCAMLYVTVGVPWLARVVAASLPAEVDDRLGRDGLELMDRMLFASSELPAADRDRLRDLLRSLAAYSSVEGQLALEFRSGADIGANAFALPSGTIVVTDELVALARSDEELAAVLAHEIGHVEARHTMRMLLQNSMTAVLFAVLLGDLTSISALAGALPTVLVQTGYSRRFETEADDYALGLLQRAGIDRTHFATILRRLEADQHGGAPPGFLATHPATERRVRRFEE